MSTSKWIPRILLLVSCVVSAPCLAATCQQTALASYQACLASANLGGSLPKGVLPCTPNAPPCQTGNAACCAGRTSSNAIACQSSYNSALQQCPFSVSVTVSGLNGGALVLEDNGASPLTITSNVTSTFAASVQGPGSYAVSVITQPPNQACTPSNGSAVVNFASATVTVAVTCVANISLGVTVCDLLGCISESQFLTNISNLLANNVVGYVAIVDNMAPVAVGEALTKTDSPPNGTPMAADLPTNVASVSKVVTTIGVLQSLARIGKTLDDPIFPYLYPDWQTNAGQNINTITFKELLTHTAGIRPLTVNNGTNTVEYCSSETSGTAYADLKAIIENGVNSSDIGVAVYNNCNFALFRELLPNMEGYAFNIPPGATQAQIDADRASQSAHFYISYINQNVFQPVGISSRTCSPPAGTSDILSYPYPAGTTAGTDWGDWTLLCGGGGWNLSAYDLLDLIYYLANGNVLLTDAQKIEMRSACLGWDCSTGADCPHPYACKNGALTNSHSGDAVRTYVGIFKCNMPVVVIVNSPISGIIRLVNEAYRGAIVTNQQPAPCP